ncbi:MAG: NAD-binding protein [Nocardioidaceae bacterium]|nr:NAD-binding protein [Nocardioidaceae bacterium]
MKRSEGYLVIGETAVARRVCATLAGDTGRVAHLTAPSDAEIRGALAAGATAVAILFHDDVAALRYALAVAHLDPELPLVVTIFDRTIAEQLRRLLPQASVISPAVLAAPSLVGPCLEAGVVAGLADAAGPSYVVKKEGRLSWLDTLPSGRTVRSRFAGRLPDLRHQDPGSRLMTLGLLGLLGALLLDLTWLLVIEHRGLPESYVDAARVVATVGPAADHAGTAYSVFSGTAMLLTILFAALFTAGVVERLVSPPLVGILGRRAVPRRGHVIVVGLGQVGIRLCLTLRRHGVPVVGVERDGSAPLLPLARRLGIPVIVGHGADRGVLERLEIGRCRALAAVGSNDLDNIAVAVAASAVSPETRVVLRAGEQEAIGETRSLLPLGVTRDVTAIAAGHVVAEFRGRRPRAIIADSSTIYAEFEPRTLEPVPVSPRQECCHR